MSSGWQDTARRENKGNPRHPELRHKLVYLAKHRKIAIVITFYMV